MSNHLETAEDSRAMAGQAVAQLCREWETITKQQQKPSVPLVPAIPETYDKKIIGKVCEYGDLDALMELIGEGVDIHANNDIALCIAAANGQLKLLRFLMDKDADIHTTDDYALKLAARNGYIETVRFLLDHDADIHAGKEEVLRGAVEHGQAETVRFLLERGADIQYDENHFLSWAANGGHTETVRVLLDHGADLHKRDGGALETAAKARWNDAAELLTGWNETVELLIERGAPSEKLTDEQYQAYNDYKQLIFTTHAHAKENLAEVFKTAIWAGHVQDMVTLWRQVPEVLKAEFDFQSALSAVTRENLKQSTTKKPRITITR
jgi:hypothetical protein